MWSALSDGDWHHIDDVREAGVRAVPPGVAFRYFERDRAANQKRKGVTSPRAMSSDAAVRRGAMLLAKNAMQAPVRSGAWERDGEMVRLRSCGQRPRHGTDTRTEGRNSHAI